MSKPNRIGSLAQVGKEDCEEFTSLIKLPPSSQMGVFMCLGANPPMAFRFQEHWACLSPQTRLP
jgi:hypothetical protein